MPTGVIFCENGQEHPKQVSATVIENIRKENVHIDSVLDFFLMSNVLIHVIMQMPAAMTCLSWMVCIHIYSCNSEVWALTALILGWKANKTVSYGTPLL